MLKNLLESAFKTVCPLIFTGSTYTDYELTSEALSVAAPFDGYAMLLASNVPNIDALTVQCGDLVSLSPTYAESWSSVYVPCRKGQTVYATVNGTGRPILRIIRTALSE